MSNSVKEEVNYWPGYVDALVNVVLNLLFLVGVFTIGLVSLNMEAVLAQQKLARLKIENMLDNELSPESKKKALVLLEKLPSKLLTQTTAETPVLPQIREIQLKAPHDATSTKPQQTPEQIALTLSGGTRVLTRFIFAKNQFALQDGEHAMPPFSEESKSQKVLLLVVTDTSNPRLAHEAYTRLVSIRDAMLRNGFDPQKVTLRVMTNSATSALPTDIDLSVFAVQIS